MRPACSAADELEVTVLNKKSVRGSGGSSGKTRSRHAHALARGLWGRHFHAFVILITLAIAAWVFSGGADRRHDSGSPVGFSDAGLVLMDSLDVGDKVDEQTHGYASSNSTPPIIRVYTYPNGWLIEDDGRGYKGSEGFTIRTRPGKDHVLVRRIDYSVPDQSVEVYADGVYVGSMTSPGIDKLSRWRDVGLLIPSKYITRNITELTMKYASGKPDANSFRYWMFVPR